jgi:hypothetical protein
MTDRYLLQMDGKVAQIERQLSDHTREIQQVKVRFRHANTR